MPPLLVASKIDPAGYGMANCLIETHSLHRTNHEFEVYTNSTIDLLLVDQEALTLDWLDDRFSPEYYVFLSRHRSESGIPTLTCHTTGNFSDVNEMGGRPKELAYTYPSLQKHYMQTLWNQRAGIPDYQLVIEATHHGPTALGKPALFVEIGSSEKQWVDKNAISVVCDAIIKTINGLKKYSKIGIGLGGTHYPSKFNELLVDSDFAVASVASKHSLPYVDRSMLDQMISKSIEDVKYVFMDWKGLGKEKDRLNYIVKELGLEVVKL
ncbi:MAG: D-aminoacyl-tRNA deacylase [Candidatus Nitrosomirales archaeon]|jgi:D-aminoacyl-tRNA deacylase